MEAEMYGKENGNEQLGWSKINGTHLLGYFPAGTKFEDLVRVFGHPNDGCDKSDAEWIGELDHGEIDEDGCHEYRDVFTIYNYKDGRNYCGASGSCVWDITNWHIGGRNGRVVSALVEYFNLKKNQQLV